MTAHLEPAPLTPPADDGTFDRTWPFLPLFAPFGISSGFLSVTLGFQLGHAGLSAIAVTTVIAASLWTQSVKMFWAPIVDAMGKPRIWYLLGATLTGLSILVMSLSPPTAKVVPFLTVMAVLGSAASTLVSMSAEILLTHGVKQTARGRASGWAQAGNVGGTGVGGGLGLFLAERFSEPWISGFVLALICVGCAGFLFLIPSVEPAHDGQGYVARLKQVVIDVWSVARSRLGYLALIIMILPIASGSAPWPVIAGDWRADADLVALVTGVVGGLAAALGALIGGYICDRLDPKTSYCAFGIAVGLVTVLMAWSPHTPMAFAIGTLVYTLIVGCGYAAYSAIVLQAIGKKSAATNFNLMAAISNMPLAFMASFDGWMHDRHGVQAMLYGEFLLPAGVIAAFALFVWATRPLRATVAA
jgi:MFS family permease